MAAMAPGAIAALERATLAAVPPQAVEEWNGWLLAFDDGTVGRACSAAPLVHGAAGDDGLVAAVQARYTAHGLPDVWRLPGVAAFDGLRAHLARQGYAARKPTLTQIGTTEAMAKLSTAQPADAGAVSLATTPGADWQAVFLGDGFDPVDAASRMRVLRRAQHTVFGTARVDGVVAAVGSACFAHGWCGVHGMRTAPALRGRGLAARLLAAFAREAQGRGIGRAFLQVEAHNSAAQCLYRRAGFATVWPYDYWARAE